MKDEQTSVSPRCGRLRTRCVCDGDRLAALEAENAQLRAETPFPISAALASGAALGQALEGIIVMRTEFTGDPPYVGNDGVILALNEALDERDKLRAELAASQAALAEELEARKRDADALATARNDAPEEAAAHFDDTCEEDWVSWVSGAIRALKSPEKEGKDVAED